jgi:hypothetical protein
MLFLGGNHVLVRFWHYSTKVDVQPYFFEPYMSQINLFKYRQIPNTATWREYIPTRASLPNAYTLSENGELIMVSTRYMSLFIVNPISGKIQPYRYHPSNNNSRWRETEIAEIYNGGDIECWVAHHLLIGDLQPW